MFWQSGIVKLKEHWTQPIISAYISLYNLQGTKNRLKNKTKKTYLLTLKAENRLLLQGIFNTVICSLSEAEEEAEVLLLSRARVISEIK